MYAHLLESHVAFGIRAVGVGRAGTPSYPYFYVARKVRMRFKAWSLGGKLILVVALTLLLCMILFSALSSGSLKYLSDRKARSDAAVHLTLLRNAYQSASVTLIHDLYQVAQNSDVSSSVSHHITEQTRQHLENVLAYVPTQYHVFLATLDILTKNRELVAQFSDGQHVIDSNATAILSLIDQALQGQVASTLQLVPSNSGSHDWMLDVAAPIMDQNNAPKGVLLAAQAIDDDFALNLLRETGANVVLCEGKRVVGSTLKGVHLTHFIAVDALCSTNGVNFINAPQRYLTYARIARAKNQLKSSPSLVIVDVEPLYSVNTDIARYVLILLAIGVLVFAFGVMTYAFITHIFFIRPLRRIQAGAKSLVA